ncbi:MAG: hypothetical protein DHS20C15_07850 [Planctomycetota bacterium]|nr:MAG: hypothetical protein DHS20C15_07850 [Planctomycetota bacterium]
MTYQGKFKLCVVLVVLLVVAGSASRGRRGGDEATGFAAAVNLSDLEHLAVHDDGRLKALASFAHQRVGFVTGPKSYRGQSSTYTYLDMLFRPEEYAEAPVIFVKNEPLRAQIASALASRRTVSPEARFHDIARERFLNEGRISEVLLDEPAVRAVLQRAERNQLGPQKFARAIQSALAVKRPDFLRRGLRLVPPMPGSPSDTPWIGLGDVHAPHDGHDAHEVSMSHLGAEQLAVLEPALDNLRVAWRAEDRAQVESLSAELASTLRGLNPEVYPTASKLAWETTYFRLYNLTWIWMVYLLAVAALLIGIVHPWKGARATGLSLFVIAFLFHTGAIGLRWWVAGRWPNSNMFEAVTTAAWFGGAAALIFEWFGRRTALRNVFALTSAVASMVAFMCAYYLPLYLDPNISNMMPVLHDVWLYIHTNVIIWSYVLIFMAAVSALLYLLHRACGGAAEFVRFGGTESLSAAGAGSEIAQMSVASSLEAAQQDSARVNAGGALEMTAGDGARIARVLDGVTMVLMELSFVMLWAGLVMGAIWADHSWGRPWGWDPKEVFALNTFLVFAVLVHTRIKVRDKGLWTAWLALIGAGVMLFNWIVINFLITGLHSYA